MRPGVEISFLPEYVQEWILHYINEEQATPSHDQLTQKQMEVLFDVKHATISEHITNILISGELDESSVGFSDKSSGGHKPQIYNPDMIVGNV